MVTDVKTVEIAAYQATGCHGVYATAKYIDMHYRYQLKLRHTMTSHENLGPNDWVAGWISTRDLPPINIKALRARLLVIGPDHSDGLGDYRTGLVNGAGEKAQAPGGRPESRLSNSFNRNARTAMPPWPIRSHPARPTPIGRWL